MTNYLEILNNMTPEDIQRIAQEANAALAGVKFIPFPGTQTRAYFSEADTLLFGGKMGGGKRLDVRQQIPVPLGTDPSGFKEHGQLKIGDEVYGANGRAVKVLAVHPVCEIPDAYEVEFNTGEKIKADAEHLWLTWDNIARERLLRCSPERREKRRKNRPSRAKAVHVNAGAAANVTQMNKDRVYNIIVPKPELRTTLEISKTIARKYVGLNHCIDIADPIQGDEIDLPLDPYWLGLWLGDGTKGKPEIGMSVDDFYAISKFVFYDFSERIETKNRKTPFCVRWFNGKKEVLRNNGLLGNKHIPSKYLRSSYEQRLSLLRGLMDTDGTASERGYCELSFSDRLLADGALELINSLGIKCTMTVKKIKGYKDHYRLKFLCDVSVFNLPRKKERQKKITRETARRRYITSVEKCDPTPMNCITVEGGLYCVGHTFIVTHNSALINGLAIQEHYRSLLVRRNHSDLRPLIDVAKELVGTEKGFIGGGRPEYNKEDGGVIHFMGLAADGGLGGMQGEAHDLIGVDEVAQVAEEPVRIITGWNRPTTKTPKGQRLRVVFGSNPPLDSTGDWLVPYFPCWLDETYPNPAADGELRWFLRDGGVDVECKKGDSIILDGQEVFAHSRTFIASDYTDNPYINSQEYASKLANMPEAQRRILMSGNFLLSRGDAEGQMIPTKWIQEAQARWKQEDVRGKHMVAMGADVTGGGSDNTAVARLYDGLYFGETIVKLGTEVNSGNKQAALIIENRRGNCPVAIDMGGGYGGGPKEMLSFSGIEAYAFNPSAPTGERTKDRAYGFYNQRALAYWRLREALDPDADGGCMIALPPSKKLLSDLATPKFTTVMYGGRMVIKMESKDEIKKRIRRSPDEGDAVVIALYVYMKKGAGNGADGFMGRARSLTVNLGHEGAKKRRRR